MGQVQSALCHHFNEVPKAELVPQIPADTQNHDLAVWWRPWHNVEMPTGPERVYIGAAQGNGGQKIFVLPEYDFVAVFTVGSYNAGGSAPNRIMNSVILPRLLAEHGGKSLATH